MKVFTKVIEGFEMTGYNDSNVDWVVKSVDSDGQSRSCTYSKKSFTLKAAFDFHNRLYRNM